MDDSVHSVPLCFRDLVQNHWLRRGELGGGRDEWVSVGLVQNHAFHRHEAGGDARERGRHG